MKHTFSFLILILLPFAGIAQTAENPPSETVRNQEEKIVALLAKIDTLMAINNELLTYLEINTDLIDENTSLLNERYKLYPTENIYTLLQLDTQTGRIEQVQWSLDADNEGSVTINDEVLSHDFLSDVPSSFELYPTKNMYQFILIDKTDGRKWHVQWGMSDKERWIREIY